MNIARPQSPLPLQILQEERRLAAKALPGETFSKYLALLTKARLLVLAVSPAAQGQAPTQVLPTSGQIGGGKLQRKGQRSQGSAKREGKTKPDKIFVSMMMTPTPNLLTGICEQAGLRSPALVSDQSPSKWQRHRPSRSGDGSPSIILNLSP